MQKNLVESFRLSPQQRHLCALWQAEDQRDAKYPLVVQSLRSLPYYVHYAVRLSGLLDISRLCRALEELVERHEILRTSFPHLSGLRWPVQVIETDISLPLEIHNYSLLSPHEQEEALSRLCQEKMPPNLWQVTLVICDTNSHWLLWDLSALLADVQTCHLLLRELGQLYEGAGIEEEELGEPLQYADLAEWQCERLESAETATGRAYWRFLEETELFTGSVPYEQRTEYLPLFIPNSLVLSLSPVEKAQIETVAQKLDVAASAVLLACWGVVLSRLCAQTDLFIGTRVGGRNYTEIADAIGPLAKSLPLQYRFPADARISSVVQQIEATVREADEWQEYFSWQPFARQGQAQGQDAQDQGQEPFCPFGFAYEILSAHWQTGSLQWIVEEQEACLDRFKLNLSCLESSHSMQVRLHFDQERFTQEDIQRLLSHWQTVLEQVLTDCEMTLGALQLLTHEEQDRQLQEWNATQVEYATGKCFHHVFEEQVELTPEAIAVVFDDVTCGFTPHLTYQELNTRANQLAHWLCRNGIGPDVLVGVFMERSLEMVIGLLGILKAGGAYVPLDSRSPDEQLAFVLEETRPTIVLTQAHLAHKAHSLRLNTFCLDTTQWQSLSEQPCTNPVNFVEPENLAYVIYTSGSTGRPKGVMITHQGLSNYLHFCRQRYPVEEGCGSIVHSSLGFDLTITSLFGPLMSGRSVYLLAEGEGMESLVSMIRRYPHLSFLKLTPAHLELLNHMLATAELAYVASALIIGGEALPASSLTAWGEWASQTHLINEYGPTETVVGCSIYEVKANGHCLTSEVAMTVPIGSPISQTQLYILDAYGHPVPIGVQGELFIGGAGVARGYKGRADLTAERFVPHPFVGTGLAPVRPGERLYRSGDLARYQLDGTIEFLGRVDEQVKLRGYRIELGEIEATLRAYPTVQEAVVILREEPAGGGQPHATKKYLVAYLVARVSEGRPATVGAGLAPALQGYLCKHLPEYMVPSVFIFLDALPLNRHGKVDRRALPMPDGIKSDRTAVLHQPRTPSEEVLAAIWASFLGREQVGIHEDFFQLGGDSMLSIQVLSQARERGIHFSVQQLFQQKTIAALVQVLGERAQKELLTEPVQALSLISSQDRLRLPADVEDAYPLTMLQRGMVFYSQYDPASGVYHDITSFHLDAPFNLQLLQTTLERLVVDHPILRTSFDLSTFSEPLQLVHRSVDIPLQVQDLRTFSSGEQEQKLSAWFEGEKSRDFVWRHPPLLRFQIHLRTENTFQLTLSFHHAILDGWSIASLLTELTKTYLSLLSGDDGSSVPPPRLLYREFVALERKFIMSQEAKQYWLEKLQGAVSSRLPRWTSSGSEAASASVYAWPVPISGETGASLRRIALSLGVPIRSVLLATHLKVLSVLHGHRDILTGFVSNGRPELADGERVLGIFLNTLPFRLALSGGTWIELIQATFAAECELLPYRWYPLIEIQKQQGGQALFETLFYFVHFHVYQDVLKVGKQTSPVSFQVLGEDTFEKTNFTFVANFSQDPISSEVHLTLLCNAKELCPEQVMAIGGYYMRTLEALATRPDADYQGQTLLSAQERERLLVEWNATQANYPQDLCLHQLFEQQVEQTPDAIAVTFSDDVGTMPCACPGFTPHLTYQQLNGQANQLAFRLLDRDIGPDRLVGVCMERSLELVITLLAILKAGGAYVPLDPSYPAERLAWMLKDAQPAVVLTQTHLIGALPADYGQYICLDVDWEHVMQEPTHNPTSTVAPQNLAYVIYTSGSTGMPKGVQVPQRAVTNFLTSMKRQLDFTGEETLLAVTPLSFDIAGLELFLPLIAGARVALVSRKVTRDGERLGHALVEHGTTIMQATPSTWRLLLEAGGLAGSTTRVLCGGETLPPDLARQLLDLGVAVWNLYGPTETTIWSTAYPVAAVDGPLPIGRPIANTQIYLLDRDLQPVPIGVTAELYIGGEGLARGYYRQPELTAEKFIANPWNSEPGERLYRTGDLARYRPDGNIEYLGRIDQQVKLRGFRIELGEIETTLQAHPVVQKAVVILHEEDEARKYLAAYVVPATTLEPHKLPGPEELQSHLREHLPDYMVPTTFVYLETLPLTPNGKVNRNALPAPTRTAQRFEGYVAPQSELERALAEIWQEVLGVQGQVSTTSNFFDLGGHSLLIIQVQSKLQTYLAYEVPLVALFQYPTIHALSTYLSRRPEQRPQPQPLASRVRKRKAALRTEELPTSDEGIAIVGLAGRFPGARNLDEFWQNLCNGVESISFFTEEELLASGVVPDLVHNPRYVKAHALLDDVESFDAAFFGYSPKEAATLDPQQRLFLECAWEALEQAGTLLDDSLPDTYKGLIGVYAGQSPSSYLLSNLLANPTFLAENDAFSTLISNDKDYLATRTSYKLNLKGPSISIQTACSTSLVAVHMACQGLLHYECDIALAGGVSIGVPQKTGYLYEEEGIFSPDGHCRAFDANARGTVPGSGVGIVVLKRLSDALADGDIIHAVIRGSAINNDGSAKVGYTAPSVEGQVNVITEAMAMAGVEPESISYVETHGTGTALGDPIEIAALTQAFRGRDGQGGPLSAVLHQSSCAIGSVKTNLGHLDAAAGVTGLIKTVLSLKHGMLPPSLHFQHPNPKIDFAKTPFYVNTHLKSWKRGSTPRRAGVSSFGIGGTNAHVILEEAPASSADKPSPTPAPYPDKRSHLILLSAKTASALETMTKQLATYVQTHPDTHLADIAYTLQIGRKFFPHRRAIVAQDRTDMLHLLETEDPKAARAFSQYTDVVTPETKQVAFLFPGQGTQYVNMGRELYEQEPTFRDQINTCARLLVPHLHCDLREILYPSTGGETQPKMREGQSLSERHLDLREILSPSIGQGQGSQLDQTDTTQPVLFAIEYALAQLLMKWGIHPQAMIGHSLGEYVAACLAGVFSLEDALALVALRGRLMQALPVGAMLSVMLPEKDVAEFLGEKLSLAASNGAHESVVSGPLEAIEQLAKNLIEMGISCLRLRTSHASHSQMMDPILESFTSHVSKIALHSPKIPYISNITGTWITNQEATDPHYWAQQLRQTVRFNEGIQHLLDSPTMILLEVGPGYTLSTLARWAGGMGIPTNRLILSSLRDSQIPVSDSAFLLNTCGRLWCAGVDIDWSQLYADEQRQRIPLPTYPFERQRYWISLLEARQAQGSLSTALDRFPEADFSWQLPKEPDLAQWFSVPSWKQSPLPALPILPVGSGQAQDADPTVPAHKPCWLIFTDSVGLGACLAENLREQEETVITVSVGMQFCRVGAWEYTLRPACAEDYDSLLKDMSSLGMFPTHIIHMWMVIAINQISSGLDYLETAQTLGFYSLLFLTQALGEQNVGQNVGTVPCACPQSQEIAIISNNLQDVIDREVLCPARATALGVGKIAPYEYPHISFRSIDIVLPATIAQAQGTDPRRDRGFAHPSDPFPDEKHPLGAPTNHTMPTDVEQLVDQMIAELSSCSSDLVVAYRGPYRWIRCFEPVRLEKVPEEKLPLRQSRGRLRGKIQGLRQQGIYLITGGLGGIGMALAEDLALRVKAKLVLTGRSALPAREEWDRMLAMTNEQAAVASGLASEVSKIRQIKRLEELGAEVLVIQADVTDLEQMQAAISQVYQRFGKLHGVIHIAGILDEGLIQMRRPEVAAKVLAPKVKGTLVLEAVLKDVQLDFLVLFSSVSALIGEVGRVDYCAANTFLDSFAFYHTAQQGVRTISINWSTWQEVDMGVNGSSEKAFKYNTELQNHLRNGILPQEGVEVFRRIIAQGTTSQVIVSTSDILARLRRAEAYLHPEGQAQADKGRPLSLQVPVTAHQRPNLQTAYVPPQNETQQQIATLCQQLFGIEKVGIYDNFLDLGGHSLLATRLITRLRDTFHVDITLHTLFKEPTVSHLANIIVQKKAEFLGTARLLQTIENVEQGPRLQPVSREQPLPLSFAQQRLWFLDRLEPGNTAYLISNVHRMRGRLDIQCFEKSQQELIRRHESLRTTFVIASDVDPRPVQVIHPVGSRPASCPLPVIDLQGLLSAQRETEVQRLVVMERQRPCDLAKGPLLRTYLFRLAIQEHMLVLTLHHIITDGWSMGLLVSELSTLYNSFVTGQPSSLAPLPIQYADYALWQRQWLQGEVLSTQLTYWKKQLADASGRGATPALQLPTDHVRPAVQTYHGASQELICSPTLSEKMRVLSRQENVTLFMVLLATFQVLLARYTGQNDISVGTPVANRRQAKIEGIIGFFVNTLVMRTDLSGNPTFLELLQRVREVCLGAYAHQDIPFEKVVEELEPERDLSRSPLFQVMLVLHNTPQEEGELAEMSITPLVLPGRVTSKFDLTFELTETKEGLHCTLEYNTDLFEANTIRRWLTNFQTLLEGVVQNPQEHISDLPLLTEAERSKLLVEWNATKMDFPQDLCVHQLFEQQVERIPDAVALVFEDKVLTYAELNRRADQLAHYLQELGVGPDEPVGICIQRCLEMALAVLAVLKAGAAVVPIDPALPKERIIYLLADAQIAVLLTHHQAREQLPDQPAQMVIDLANGSQQMLREAGSAQGPHSLLIPPRPLRELPVQPDHLCYVIYTSGSTGFPKGVGVPHCVLVNLLAWHRCHLLGGVRTLQFARLSFDASFHEMFATWCTGGMLFLLAESMPADVRALARFLRDRAVEKVILPVVMLHQLAALPQCWSSHLKEVTTTGEQLQINPATVALFAQLPNAVLHNHYGPSETHVVTAYTLQGSPDQWPTHPSIGQPIANTDLYILDKYGQPVPIGVVGELYIGGVNLARGYIERADLTAERFVPHPFSQQPGARLYRTGDLVRYLPDGCIEYLGRIDHQVKLRGFRIELGEIESVLQQHPAVREVIVLTHEEPGGKKYLVAYVVLHSAGILDDLRQYLQAKLPDYMIPSFFVALDTFPLTSNGKVDRKALPKPDATKPEREGTFVAPRTTAEEVVAKIWSDLLGVEQVGVQESFFELGGHSLLAAQLVWQLQNTFQIELPLHALFEKPTIEGLLSKIAHLLGGYEMVEEIALVLEEIASLSEDEAQDLLSR